MAKIKCISCGRMVWKQKKAIDSGSQSCMPCVRKGRRNAGLPPLHPKRAPRFKRLFKSKPVVLPKKEKKGREERKH